MKKSSVALQTIAVAIMAIAAVIVLIKQLKGDDVTAPAPIRERAYKLRLLSQEAASDGKVVSAIKDGKVIGGYKCTAQDAAVAWLFDDGATKYSQIEVLPTITDGSRQYHNFGWFTDGPLMRVVFPRGYRSKPKSVAITFRPPGRYGASQAFQMTHFADPTRFLQAPKNAQPSGPDPDVSAQCTVTPDGSMSIHVDSIHPSIQEMALRREKLQYHVLCSSFCPPGPQSPYFEFGNESDAIQIIVNRYREVDSVVTLIYKNAQIESVNGVRLLRLPTTQDVGTILGNKATVQKLLPFPSTQRNQSKSEGDMIIRLDRKSQILAWEYPRAEIIGISPTVDQLGLDILKFRIADTYSTTLRSTKKSATGAFVIPELKIFVRITDWKRLGSENLVLPVQHVRNGGQKARESVNEPLSKGFSVNLPPPSVRNLMPRTEPVRASEAPSSANR